MDEGGVCELAWSDGEGVDKAQRRYGAPVVRYYEYRVTPRMFEQRLLVLSKRDAEVVLVLRRPSGFYLLHCKVFYPQGLYRLLSGGIDRGEALLHAAEREVREETGLGAQTERFLAIQRHVFRCGDQAAPFTSYLLLMAGETGTPHPQDDDEAISEFREVPLEALLGVAETLEGLPPDWVDWGRYRATAHRLVVELLAGQGDPCLRV